MIDLRKCFKFNHHVIEFVLIMFNDEQISLTVHQVDGEAPRSNQTEKPRLEKIQVLRPNVEKESVPKFILVFI